MENKTSNLTNDEKLKNNLSGIKKKFIVLSGKGGVGKTTVSVNLAYSLALKNYKVGLLDVDIHGPNVAKMLGIENAVFEPEDSRIPTIKVLPNLEVMSMALFLENSDTPVIWRGPLKIKLIRQFLEDVNWGNLDYLIIDSPPGTGDEPLSVIQLIPGLTGAIIVTTPQEVAVLDARKSIEFVKQLKVPYIGLIENMSGLVCPHCGGKIDLFKSGSGKKIASDLNIDFLGDIPLEPNIVVSSDQGNAFIKDSNLIATQNFMQIVSKIEKI